MKILFTIALALLLHIHTDTSFKEYVKDYYPNGIIKSEGWIQDGHKNGYWKYYYPNGVCMKMGHYKNDKQVDYWYYFSTIGLPTKEGHFVNGEMGLWWLFYDSRGRINHKCQLNKGIKDGYCLRYEDKKLTSAEKYENGKKIKEWFDFDSFRKENKLSDLR